MGGAPEPLLTGRQLELLDELGAASTPTGQEDPSEAPAAGFEAFHRHWRRLRGRRRLQEEARRRQRWRWIDEVQALCGSACGELGQLLEHLGMLEEQRQEVVRKTTALHERCEQMVHDQEQLTAAAEALSERLDVFDRVPDVARVLDQGNPTSHPDFGSALDQLDYSIAFLEAHYDFSQAQAYLHQFEHLRNRACIAMRSALQKSLEKSAAQVEQQLRERAGEGSVETQVFYARFRAAALNYRSLTALLHKRTDVHETYMTTLEELEAFYVHLRIRLVSSPVTAHLQAVLHKELQMSQLAPATRQASSYILDVSHFERQCFESYFELRQPQEALRLLLESVADIFYKTLRPVVLGCASIDSLREMADCLQMDILEPHQHSARSDLVPVLAVVFRLYKDVQERLIYRVETYIRDDIKGYQITGSDIDYPALLFSAAEAAGGSPTDVPEFQRGWFPTMQRTLGILAKIYRVLEMSTFQGLAQEAVDLCVVSLRGASQQLSRRPVRDGSTPVHGQLVQMLDSHLFLIKHLLLLREQVAAFECDLVANEKYFNFSNVWEALHLKLPDGLLGILKPKLCQSQVDSKKDIEAELKASCEALITGLAAHITQPLAVLNTQVGDFLGLSGADRKMLKEQAFMQPERIQGVVVAFSASVRELVPFAAAHIRLYLAAPGGAAGGGDRSAVAQSTASILFKPVQLRLVDTWGRLEGLLRDCEMSPEDIERLGFMRPEVLQETVALLFQGVMDAPWETVVEIVSKVTRTAVAIRAPGSASLPAAEAAEVPAALPEPADGKREGGMVAAEPGAPVCVPGAPPPAPAWLGGVAPPPPLAPA